MTVSIYIYSTVAVWRWWKNKKSKQCHQLSFLVFFAASFQSPPREMSGGYGSWQSGGCFWKRELHSHVLSPPSFLNHPQQLGEEDLSRWLPKTWANMWLRHTQETRPSCPKCYQSDISGVNMFTQPGARKQHSSFIIHWLAASGRLWVRAAFLITWGGKGEVSTSFQAYADNSSGSQWCMEEVALMWRTA